MGLTAQQLKEREGKLTASSVGYLMSGDREKINSLWRELTGDPSYFREDLSDIWPIELGNTTEQLNLNWYEKKTGYPVTRRGEVVIHQTVDWAACTLDGWIDALKCPIECKHVGGREPFERIITRYMPQMHWQMDVMQSSTCMFSVIEGASEPRLEVVTYDAEYSRELWRRAYQFMECVHTLTPSVEMASIEAPAPVSAWREVSFQGNNEWADQAAEWLEHRQSAKKAERAEESLKAMMPADSKEAKGHGVKITRSRNNRLTLKAA